MRSLAMQALTKDYKVQFPGIVIYGISNEEHQDHPSDHNEDDTPGSNPAQTDADNVAEHRAIDVMLGPAFNRAQALATINTILAQPKNRKRLRYINFETTQWHVNNNFQPMPNPNDPHPTHIHFSQQAASDDDATSWFGAIMTQEELNMHTADTWRLLTILENRVAAQYQLAGEATPRNEPNLLRAKLEELEGLLNDITAKLEEDVVLDLSEAQLDSLATKVANKLRALTFVAEEEV